MRTDGGPGGETTRITRKGQVTIPKGVREAFDLEEGDEVRWDVGDDGIVLRKASRSTGRGMLVDEDTPEEKREEMITEMSDAIREKRQTEWLPE